MLEFLASKAKAPHDFKGALAAFDARPPDLRLIPYLSPVLARRRDLEATLRARRIAYEHAPGVSRVLGEYVGALCQSDPQRALELVRSSTSDHPTLQRNHAVLEASDGDAARACSLYEALLARAPEDWALHNNLAFLLVELGRAEEALEHANLAASHQRNAESLDTLGWALHHLERYAEAEEQLRESLELAPPTASTQRLHLCATLLARGRREEAQVQLRYAELLLPIAEGELRGRDLERLRALAARLRRELGT